MAKVVFTTFFEASEYSKQLSKAIKRSTSIQKDGDIWWVEDPRIADGDTEKIVRYKKALNLQQDLFEQNAPEFMVVDEMIECAPVSSADSPLLKLFGRNLTKEAARGLLGPFFGREDELQKIIRTLARKSKNNPILVGEPGVGKTALVEALAIKGVKSGREDFLHGKVIIELGMGGLIAGTKYRGEFEERLTELVKEVQKRPEVILFIDEIHTLVGSGESEGSALDGANILKPALSRRGFCCIGATTGAEYSKYIESDKALARRFEKITVDEPDRAESIRIAKTLKRSLEKHHKVTYDDEAIAAAVDLSTIYDAEHFLPDKAIDLLDKAGALVSFSNKDTDKTVHSSHISWILSEKTGMSVAVAGGPGSTSFNARMQALPDRMKKRIIGQDMQIDQVLRKLRVAYSGLSRRSGPVAVFLCIGPSGVGKTELAKTLADNFFGGNRFLIRLDMSEFMEEHSLAKLIGSPPGYVGHNEEGQLTGKLRTRPHSILLLDEVEKAHPRIMDIFLQLFGEGRITDAKGVTVDAANTIVIMTSNIRPEESARIGFGTSAHGSDTPNHGYLKKYFRTELINRIDEVVIFNRLERDSIRKIIAPMLEEIHRNLRKRTGADMTVSNEVIEFLISKGCNHDFGVRELKRTVEQFIQGDLSELIVNGGLSGCITVHVGMCEGKIVFSISNASENSEQKQLLQNSYVEEGSLR